MAVAIAVLPAAAHGYGAPVDVGQASLSRPDFGADMRREQLQPGTNTASYDAEAARRGPKGWTAQYRYLMSARVHVLVAALAMTFLLILCFRKVGPPSFQGFKSRRLGDGGNGNRNGGGNACSGNANVSALRSSSGGSAYRCILAGGEFGVFRRCAG